jgi:hypothetical protein
MEDIDSIDPDFARASNPASSGESSAPAKLLSLKMEGGFPCFFRRWVESNQVSISECYDLVLKSHLQLERLRWPINRVLTKEDSSWAEKSNELLRMTTRDESFYFQNKNEDLYRISYAKQREEKIKQLEMQVELYRRRSEEALEAKREQFRKVTAQEEEARRRVLEEQERRQRVLRSLNKEINRGQ